MSSQRVRLGINPLTWTNDDMPELGAETSLETCLKEARQAGFEGVELGNKFPRTPEVLGPILAPHGLSLVSGWYSSNLLERKVADEILAIEPHLHLLQTLGCGVLILAETTGAIHGDRKTGLSKRPVLPASEWSRFGAALTQLAEHTLRRGVRLVYHHHMGTVVQTEEEIDRLMASTGKAFSLLLDTGHLTYARGNPAAVARRHGKRIAHLHAKDVRAKVLDGALAEDLPFLEAVLRGVFTVPGDGQVDYPAVLPELERAGYRGWAVVEAEQDPAKAHPLTYATMGHRNLSGLLDRAGFSGA